MADLMNVKALTSIAARKDLPDDAKTQLNDVIEDMKTPLQTDKWIYRIVVGALGMTIIITVLGGILLALRSTSGNETALPQGIIAIGSAAVGALAGLLAPSPKG